MTIENILSLNESEIEKLQFIRSTDSISTMVDGETVIMGVSSGKYSGLNEVGSVVWNLLEKPVSFTEVREAVLAQFEVNAEDCASDLLSFLNSLAEHKLIEVKIETNR